jgi:hypothetical protein
LERSIWGCEDRGTKALYHDESSYMAIYLGEVEEDLSLAFAEVNTKYRGVVVLYGLRDEMKVPGLRPTATPSSVITL